MLSDLLATALRKAQILEFLGLSPKSAESKQELLAVLQQLIETDAHARVRLLETFPGELAIGPNEAQQLLKCTLTERRRWIKEGKLPVLEYRPFREGGRELLYPVHDRLSIEGISQETVARWREEHQEAVSVRRKIRAQTAFERRRIHQQVRQEFFIAWQRGVEEWIRQGSAELASVLQLSYWTVWASRWAKEYHLKSLHAIKHSSQCVEQRELWYQRKNQAMRILARTPYAKLSYYRPANADKRSLWLCAEHYEMKEERYYENIWDFFLEHSGLIRTCTQCSLQEEKDYYALYYLDISTEQFPELRFSFHIPYPIGKAWLPKPSLLPKVEHREQDGIFRFGRPLLEDERITYREQDVLAHFECSLAETQRQFGSEDEL